MLQLCRTASRKPAHYPETAVFLRMTDKHANLCLFPCLFSFPLGFAWYYNFPCGVDTEKSCFAHIQTILYYFLKGTVNNFSCFLLFLFMSLFSLHSDHNCCPFPCFFPLSLSLSLSRSSFVPSLPLLDVAGKQGWQSRGVSYGVKNT